VGFVHEAEDDVWVCDEAGGEGGPEGGELGGGGGVWVDGGADDGAGVWLHAGVVVAWVVLERGWVMVMELRKGGG